MLIGEDFEDIEAKSPLQALRSAGHEVDILGAEAGDKVRGKRGGFHLRTDIAASDAKVADYDALVIPGGYGPDHLRLDDGAVALTTAFMGTPKPVAAICHGPQLLIEADAVRGKRITSWPSVKTDLINAGAQWVDERCVTDGNLITSRKPGDLEAFNDCLLSRIASYETTN